MSLKKALIALTRKHSPDTIQHELAKIYDEYAVATDGEENEFWFKCGRASHNLSSGMNKWAHEMLEGEE